MFDAIKGYIAENVEGAANPSYVYFRPILSLVQIHRIFNKYGYSIYLDNNLSRFIEDAMNVDTLSHSLECLYFRTQAVLYKFLQNSLMPSFGGLH